MTLAIPGCGPYPTEGVDNDIHSQEASVGEACFKSEGQPGICNYGDYCQTITSQCTRVPHPTCNNFSIHGRIWNADTSTGPVIYEAKAIRFTSDATYCGHAYPTRATFRLKAYAPTADLPTSIEGFSGRLVLVPPSGGEINITAVQNIMTTNGNKHITFDVSLCFPSGTASYTAGFFFVGGNEVCVTAS